MIFFILGTCVNTIGSYQCIVSTTQPTTLSKHRDDADVDDDDDDDDGDDADDNDVTLCESGYRFDGKTNTCVDVDECKRLPKIASFNFTSSTCGHRIKKV